MNPISFGKITNRALPDESAPLAVLPTLWRYSSGSLGGSYCIIQSTSGKSNPLWATSVHSNIPLSEFKYSK